MNLLLVNRLNVTIGVYIVVFFFVNCSAFVKLSPSRKIRALKTRIFIREIIILHTIGGGKVIG